MYESRHYYFQDDAFIQKVFADVSEVAKWFAEVLQKHE